MKNTSTTSQKIQQVDLFKTKYHYWDEWTGARFVRVENPAYNTSEGKDITPKSVCRVDPSTGRWHPL